MLGDTLTVTVGGSGGTANVVSKIQESGYSSEYLKKNTSDEIRVRVRHIRENARAGTAALDRHQVIITQFVYPTEVKPLGLTREVQFILRNDPTDAVTDVTNIGEALAFWLTASNLDKLFGWES